MFTKNLESNDLVIRGLLLDLERIKGFETFDCDILVDKFIELQVRMRLGLKVANELESNGYLIQLG